jgi:hypothetical protein
MQSVAVDHANPESGEEAFVLQLRLPDAQGADGGALMDKIGNFVGLYLSAAEPDSARFAQMGGLTWVIAAPADTAATLDQVRADLASTLYGQDDGTQVQLEWPEGVFPKASDTPDADAASDVDEADDDVWAMNDTSEPGDQADTETGIEPWADPETVADDQDEPAMEAVADDVDLDIDAFELDEPSTEVIAEPALGAEAEIEADVGADDVFVLDDAPEDLGEDIFDVESDLPAPVSDAQTGPAEDYAASDDWNVASAAQRAAFDDSNSVFEIDALDIDIVDGPGLASDPAEDTPIDPLDVDLNAPFEIDGLDDLTEAPERPQPADMAAELAAFRTEMREIAAGIPGATSDETLAEFRAELDAIAGAMGQRVDGAAQRIEAAADRVIEETSGLNGERLAAAAERAEQSAKLLETGVSDALSVLSAAARAMSEPAFLTSSKTNSQ